MSESTAQTLADPIAHLIERLVEMARLCMGMPLVNRFLATLAWGRMRRLEERFARLKARLAAGTLRPPRVRGEAAAGAGEGGLRVRVRQPRLPFLPRSFGWFARMVPGAGPAAQEFEGLLADPGMPGLVSAAPQAGRILRPLAHMLGVKRPGFLRLPRRPRKRQQARSATPRPGPPDRVRGQACPQGGREMAQAPRAQPPPQPSRSAEEERALAHARRPGGLYWDGTRFRWS